MGRYGDESSKEDTRRGWHRLEVLVGRVHGLAGGAVISPQGLFGRRGSSASRARTRPLTAACSRRRPASPR
eukprot:3341033-Prymnesium_polylepis.1